MRATKLVVLILTIAVNTAFAQKNFELSNTKIIPIQDSKTGGNYELYVELPEKYAENPDKAYPVLYYTDAVWHIEALSACQEFILEDVILVGISWQKDINEDLKEEVGAHVSRFRDYSISKHDNPEVQQKYQLGQAKTHLDFIRNDVITYVDNTYRTDPDSRTYFGYSLSGEFGAYILLTQPDTFNNYIIGSPSIKTDVPALAALNSEFGPFEASNRNSSLNANVFIAYGSLEEEEVTEPIEEFIKLLNDRRDNGLSLQREIIEGNHQTAFPMTAVRSAAWLSTAITHDSNTNNELSLWKVPQLNNAFINTSPEDKKDGIAVGELGVDTGDKETILTLAEEIADHKHGRFDSFLIVHKDTLIFESYYARGRIDLPHGQASATKAYTCLALGRAIQMGYLSMDDLDKTIIDFLNELDPTKFVEGAEKITLNKALTMRSGVRIDEEKWKEIEKDTNRLKGQGHVQVLLEHSEPITTASQSFKYQDDPGLVMQVLDAVVPSSAKDFIKTELLDKLGITNYKWRTDVSGLPTAGWGSSMTSRDMVKWGILVMNKGKWNGEQLIPKAYIDKALSRLLLTGDDDVYGGGKDVSKQGYGYYWWSADLKHGDTTYFASSAQGGGGQYIILVEELDLMVVITAHDNDNATLQLTAERIIPAFLK
ncbi:serine hydrolase [Allomuricauda sp. d1]|uniref:serine hydrolase n=1 Tax=Allomuricauda sp. d1 TaxID=3136725 RepID=UPI0031E30AE0